MTRKAHVSPLLEPPHIPHQAYASATGMRPAGDLAHAPGIPAREVYKTVAVLPLHATPLPMIMPRALDRKRPARVPGV